MAISDCVALDALRVGTGLKRIAFISHLKLYYLQSVTA